MPSNPALAERVRDAIAALEEIVCVDDPDRGVVKRSGDGLTEYDRITNRHIYKHEHFSPLGDALIALHESLASIAAAADALEAARTPGPPVPQLPWSVYLNGKAVAAFRTHAIAINWVSSQCHYYAPNLEIMESSPLPPAPEPESKGGPVIHGVEMHVGHGGFASANEAADWESVTAAWPELERPSIQPQAGGDTP